MSPPIPPSISPRTRAKAAAGETPQLPSQQTDESLCPGSWLLRKPPISFPVGTGCRGFSLLRSITEQVSSSQPLFLGTCLELLSRAQIPFQEVLWQEARGCNGPHCPQAEPCWTSQQLEQGPKCLSIPVSTLSQAGATQCPHDVPLWSATLCHLLLRPKLEFLSCLSRPSCASCLPPQEAPCIS